MNINTLKNILNNLYLWDEDNSGELKVVLVDSDNYETEIDGIYLDIRNNKLHFDAGNMCDYSNTPDFKTLYRKG